MFLSFAILAAAAAGQTPAARSQDDQEEVVRISSQLVQTDVVVTDKNDRVIDDLKLEDSEVFENGKRQELRFMEFVGVDAPAPKVLEVLNAAWAEHGREDLGRRVVNQVAPGVGRIH